MIAEGRAADRRRGDVTVWSWLIVIYIALAFVTLLPTLRALFSGVKLNEGGASFQESRFSEEAKLNLEQHFSRLQGTLAFWKREATLNAIIAAHVALLLGFHRGLKVAEHFKAFRHGESEFYDTYRRLLDSPETFGPDEDGQLKRYFEEVEIIRRFVRNAETDSLPMVEDLHVNSVVKQ